MNAFREDGSFPSHNGRSSDTVSFLTALNVQPSIGSHSKQKTVIQHSLMITGEVNPFQLKNMSRTLTN